MINLKIITKSERSKLDLPVLHISLGQTKNVSSIVDEIENKKWLYSTAEGQDIIVKFKEIPECVLLASGINECGSSEYCQRVNMSKNDFGPS